MLVGKIYRNTKVNDLVQAEHGNQVPVLNGGGG